MVEDVCRGCGFCMLSVVMLSVTLVLFDARPYVHNLSIVYKPASFTRVRQQLQSQPPWLPHLISWFFQSWPEILLRRVVSKRLPEGDRRENIPRTVMPQLL